MSSDIRRSRRGRTYIIIGTVLAVLAFATAAGVASLPFFFSSAAIGTKVVVAKNAISARTQIQASDLTLAVITPVPKLAFYDVKAVEGKGARVDIPADAPITANLIAQSPDLLSSSDVTYLPIPQGFVAVQVPTSELVGVGGYVQLGDRITVLATINTSVFGACLGDQRAHAADEQPHRAHDRVRLRIHELVAHQRHPQIHAGVVQGLRDG